MAQIDQIDFGDKMVHKYPTPKSNDDNNENVKNMESPDLLQLLKKDDKGWNIKLFEDEIKITACLCDDCNSVCCDAVVLGCDHNDGDVFTYCNNCLSQLIEDNDGLCPINRHIHPIIVTARSIRRQILNAMVICPYSIQYKQQKHNNNNKENDHSQIIDTIGNDENKYDIEGNQGIGCEWRATLNDLLQTDHLNKCITKYNPSYLQNITINTLKQKVNEQETEIIKLNQQLKEQSILTESFVATIHDKSKEINKLKQEISALKQLQNSSEIEQHIEYQYKSQIQALEERLSKMTVSRITMEDDFNQKQKLEQERADKYRSKYESVKQHIKTLEIQKVEYTRVNMQLRQQNEQFRSMINRLESISQLKMVNNPQNNGNDNNNDNNNDLLAKQDVDILQKQQQIVIPPPNILSTQIQENKARAYQELWGKRTKIISEKGTKKRLLIEWHFVTSDDQPHTTVLQHTQDETKLKTRRMLWVDGSEKYNMKSSALSFRIEVDMDVVVVSIANPSSGVYQYKLTINNMNYTDAFKAWNSKQ